MNGTDAHMFEVRFAGEGSQDVGGPFREMLTNLVAELESETLPLLIKTPNHRNDHGQSRESYTLNPSSISPTHGELFKFFGFFLGFCLRTGSAMDWHFPPLFWKQLMGESVGLSDLEGLDAYSYQVLRDLNKYGRELDAEKFNAVVVETFTTLLSNGQEVELRPDGASVEVTQANHQEFVDAVLKARLDECEKQMNWLKEGITHVIDLSILSFLTWEEVEIRACGPKDIDVEVLKSITEYRSCSADHKIVVWFWQMFEAFTQEERKQYLKFVWGRSKLPLDCSSLAYRHRISVCSHLRSNGFPEAHTCFFAFDLPEYPDFETMVAKVKYAIATCGEIDADYGAGDIADEAEGENGGGEEE